MKRKLFLMGIFILFSSATAFAQIENEIEQSKSEQIRKGRDYLLEKFLERDYDKVKETKDYLLELETEDIVAFRPIELWYVLFWTQEFVPLTTSFRHIDSAYVTNYKNKVLPPRDQMLEKIHYRSVEDEHLLRVYLQEAALPNEDLDFLNLFLDWNLKPTNQKSRFFTGYAYEDEEINESADKFLSQYPHSDYEWFVRHMIRVKYGKPDFGFGLGIDLCTGLSSDVFPKPVGGFGINMDVYYKKYILTLGMDILYSKSREDVPYTINSVPHIYPKGSENDLIVLYADLSYPIIEKEKIRLAPCLGIGVIETNFPNDKEEGSTLTTLNKDYLSYYAGLCFDVNRRILGDEMILRIKYRFGMSFPDGSIATVNLISVGWNMDFRWPKRVY